MSFSALPASDTDTVKSKQHPRPSFEEDFLVCFESYIVKSIVTSLPVSQLCDNRASSPASVNLGRLGCHDQFSRCRSLGLSEWRGAGGFINSLTTRSFLILFCRFANFAGAKDGTAAWPLLLSHANITIYAMCYWMTVPILPFVSKNLGADPIVFGYLQTAFSAFQARFALYNTGSAATSRHSH